MNIDSTEITLEYAGNDYVDHLTFAEAGAIVGASERYIRIAVRDGGLPAAQGEDGTPKVTRAALGEFIPPIFQQIGHAWRDFELGQRKKWSRYAQRLRAAGLQSPATPSA